MHRQTCTTCYFGGDSYPKGDLIHMDSISTFRASAHNKCTCPYRMQMFVPFENASKNIAE